MACNAVRFVTAALLGLLAAGASLAATVRPAGEDLTPVVFVSGMTGTQLVDPSTGRKVWGRAFNLVWPRDRGYDLALPLADGWAEHPQSGYQPVGPLWKLRLLGWKKKIYQPLLRFLETAGYSLGNIDEPEPKNSLFFFDYDWRRDNRATAQRLAATLTQLAESAGATSEAPKPFDLVCQSNAAKLCRFVVKYGEVDSETTLATLADRERRKPARFQVRKVVLIGASNGGALRTLDFLNRGRRYIPIVGRKMSQETFFSIRPLLADLPLHRNDLFFDLDGKPLEVDLADPETWVRYGWSVFSGKPERRLDRNRRPDLFGDDAGRQAFLRDQLERAARLNQLLGADSPDFPATRYYLMENESQPTAGRALLHKTKKGWRIAFFDDRPVAGNPRLRALALEPGDGHATVSSQRRLSPQELAAVADSRRIEGGHFEMIIEPEGLNALLSFLAD